MANLTVSPILDFAVSKNASDIHISEGSFIVLRVDGKLLQLESTGKLEKVKVNQILLELLNEQKDLIKEFISKKDLDFSYVSEKGISFRINAFFKLGKVSLVMRKIESNVPSLDELMLPEGAKRITKMKSGLVIVSGAAGSGKSTTITSILEDINNNRGEHIITVENPVEFIFTNKKSIFSQRNTGRDTKSISSALISALREDGNIIMIGEIKNKEIMNLAMDLVESGLLVIAGINASTTSDTIKKIFGFYNNDEQKIIQNRLSLNLKTIIFQKLVEKIGGKGRIGLFEVLIVTENIELLLKSGKTNEISNIIHVGLKEGMISLSRYSDMLVEKGLMTKQFKDEHFSIQ